MSDDNKNETTETPASKDAGVDPVPEQHEQDSTQSGPTFTKGPDPLAGVKKGAAEALDEIAKTIETGRPPDKEKIKKAEEVGQTLGRGWRKALRLLKKLT